jgi:hypothetical protein
VSCYAPELTYFDALTAADGYLDGGMSRCNGAATTGEDLGPYHTQDVSNPAMRVKDHSESDIRVDPTNPMHLIGQSRWAVSAEDYNHLNGFYESFDGGVSWPIQGHVPGYEGWTDNTDPVGAFDPWGNFYSLVLPYQFYYDNHGFHKYANGSKQTNPTVPPEAVAVSVHPAGSNDANDWITTHDGQPDYVVTVPNADTNVPDKQWITIDTNPASPHYGRVYAMWTIFVLNPAVVYESHADASPDGTHSSTSSRSSPRSRLRSSSVRAGRCSAARLGSSRSVRKPITSPFSVCLAAPTSACGREGGRAAPRVRKPQGEAHRARGIAGVPTPAHSLDDRYRWRLPFTDPGTAPTSHA